MEHARASCAQSKRLTHTPLTLAMEQDFGWLRVPLGQSPHALTALLQLALIVLAFPAGSLLGDGALVILLL